MAALAVSVTPVLLAINILHDWTYDASSHNLFPFEFLIYAFISAPAVIGALLGWVVSRALRRTREA